MSMKTSSFKQAHKERHESFRFAAYFYRWCLEYHETK